MLCVDFASRTLKTEIAPSGAASSTKERIRLASRRLGWTFSRTKDVWYSDPRVKISADEMSQLETVSGVTYAARTELRTTEQLIARAEALLDGPDADFHRPMVSAMVAFIRALSGPGTAG